MDEGRGGWTKGKRETVRDIWCRSFSNTSHQSANDNNSRANIGFAVGGGTQAK